MALTITSQAYRDQLFSADPSHMVVMIYDEVLEALGAAVQAIERGDIEARCNAITVATELLATLYGCLDAEKGGNIAGTLGAIYAVILRYLPKVNLHNDPEVAKQAMNLLTPLREAWAELDTMPVVDGWSIGGRPAARAGWTPAFCERGAA